MDWGGDLGHGGNSLEMRVGRIPGGLGVAVLFLVGGFHGNAHASADQGSPDSSWTLNGDNLRSSVGAGGRIVKLDRPFLNHGSTEVTALLGVYHEGPRILYLQDEVNFFDGATHAIAERASYDRNDRILNATGNVYIQSDSLSALAPNLLYDRQAETAELSGGVDGNHGARGIQADRIKWLREDQVAILTGRARITEPDGASWVQGERIVYDLATENMTVTGSPMLITTQESGGTSRVTGNQLWLTEGSLTASGDVQVHRSDIVSYSDSAVFLEGRQEAQLLGSPRIEEPNGTLTGEHITLYFNDDESLDRAHVTGRGVMNYAPVDSLGNQERTILEGNTLLMFFDEFGPTRIEAAGQAHSVYLPPRGGGNASLGTNVAGGDSILVFFGDEDIERVRVSGNAKGTYTFSSAGSDSTVIDSLALGAGSDSTTADSLGRAPWPVISQNDSTLVMVLPADSLRSAGDSARVDSVAREVVHYQAREVLFEVPERIVNLTGEGQLDYDPLTLTAGKIRFFVDERYLEAAESPVLKDRSGGQDEIIGSHMDYNIDTREGAIDGGRTSTEDGYYVYADRMRQVGENDFLARQGYTTTCPLAKDGKDPHFHFRSSKMRLYKDDKAVAKPVALYIRDIPVFALPFYVFSLNSGRQSGFLTPSIGYGVGGSSNRFISNFGYYWVVSDYMDLTFSMDYYQGPARFTGAVKWDYKWNKQLLDGGVNLRQRWQGSGREIDFTARHTQTLGAWRVTGRGEYRDQNFRLEEPGIGSAGQIVDRRLDNDLSITRNFGFGGSLQLSLRHLQDLITDEYEQTLPGYSFSMNSRPLGRKGDEYTSSLVPFLSTTQMRFSSRGSWTKNRVLETRVDSIGTQSPDWVGFAQADTAGLDTTNVLVDLEEASARHSLSLTDSRRFGPFSAGPSFSVTEHWVDREFSASDTTKGFHRAAVWRASVNANTTMFGTVGGIGPVVAVRHRFQPRASVSFSPDFKGLAYQDSSGVNRSKYPGVSTSKSQSLNLSISNNFQAKVRTSSGVQRMQLFDWNLSSSYNMLGVGKKWRDIRSDVSLRQIAGVSLSFTSQHDPYAQFRTQNFSLTGGYNISGVLPGADAGVASGGSQQGDNSSPTMNDRGANMYEGNNQVGSRPTESKALAWQGFFSFSYNGSRFGSSSLDKNATLNSNLSLQITKNWSIGYRNLWRITDGEVTGERISLRRDLHCWEASFTGNKVGDDLTFYFTINVKDIQELKIEQRESGPSPLGGLSNYLP